MRVELTDHQPLRITTPLKLRASAQRLQVLALGGVLLLACVLFLARWDSFQIGAWGDDAHYIVSARSLATGNGYALPSQPDNPPEVTYPPGYPALLAPLAALFPGSLSIFKVPSLLLTLALLPLWFVLLRRRLPAISAFVILFAATTNTVVVALSTMVMSEALFALFIILLYLLLDTDRYPTHISTYRSLSVALVLIGAYFTRTVGIVFLLPTILYLVALRQFKATVIVLCLFALPFSAWAYRNTTISADSILSPGYEQHVSAQRTPNAHAGSVADTMARRIHASLYTSQYYATKVVLEVLAADPAGSRLEALIETYRLQPVTGAFGLLLTGLVALGCAFRLCRQPRFPEFATLCYLGALLIWPWAVSRFLHPVIPLLYLFLFEGIRVAMRRLPLSWSTGHLPARLSLSIIGLLAIVNLYTDIRGALDPVRNRITDLAIATPWIAHNVPDDSVLMAEFAINRHLYTQRVMVELPDKAMQDESEYIAAVRRSGAEYILIAPPLRAVRQVQLSPSATRMEQALAGRPNEFRVVFEIPEENLRLYRMLPPGSDRPGAEDSLAATFQPEEPSTIIVDPRVVYQRMDGFGTSARLFDDPHLTDTFDPERRRGAVVVPPSAQDEIMDRLYVDLRLNRVRPITEANIQPIRGGPFHFEWKGNDAHMEYVHRAIGRGVDTYFLSPIRLENWMTEHNPEEYVGWAMAVLRRWREYGLQMPYYSIVNEPGQWGSGMWSGAYLRDVAKLLGRQLANDGFVTRIVVPDDIRASEAYNRARIILADPEARSYIAALAFHIYGEPISNVARLQQLGAEYGLPLWMTEYSETDWFKWADIMHDLIAAYDVSAVDYMWGFFGQQDRAQLISIRHNGHEYRQYEMLKQYYVTGQYSRYIRPGAVRIAAVSMDPAVKATAFHDERTGEWTVVLINNDPHERRVSVALRDAPVNRLETVYRTSARDNWSQLPGVELANQRFSVVLGGQSITTFTTVAAGAPGR